MCDPSDPATLLTIASLGVALVVLLITWATLSGVSCARRRRRSSSGSRRECRWPTSARLPGWHGGHARVVAMVIALGTVIGKLLGGIGRRGGRSSALRTALGERRLDWALMLSGFIIGLPVFFQVGLVLLAPVLFTAQRQTGTPLLRLGLPMVAGLSAAHGLVPPHPGPIAAIERLGADPGRTLFYSLILGLPLSIISGPLYARYICRRVHVEPGRWPSSSPNVVRPRRTPTLGVTLVTMLMPVLLMLLASAAQIVMADGTLRRAHQLRRQPARRDDGGHDPRARDVRAAHADSTAQRLLKFAEESLPPIAGVLLVVGAGGGFGRVLVIAHVDTAIAQAMGGLQLSPLVMGWVIASLLRLSVGSATVSVITAASIMAPLIAGMPTSTRSCSSSRSAPDR